MTGSVETGHDFEMPPVAAGPVPDVSLSYSSGVIDGMTASRNNQPGVVGAGWSMGPGHITRHTASCAGFGAPAERCIYADEYSIVLGGTSSRLLPVEGAPDTYRLEQDPHWQVRRLRVSPVPADAPDSRGEYWEVTQPDGTVFRFGGGAYMPTGERTHNSVIVGASHLAIYIDSFGLLELVCRDWRHEKVLPGRNEDLCPRRASQ